MAKATDLYDLSSRPSPGFDLRWTLATDGRRSVSSSVARCKMPVVCPLLFVYGAS